VGPLRAILIAVERLNAIWPPLDSSLTREVERQVNLHHDADTGVEQLVQLFPCRPFKACVVERLEDAES
jgi:hypothetical protein